MAAITQPTLAQHVAPVPSTQMQGGWIIAARLVWLLTALLTLGVFVIALPLDWALTTRVQASEGVRNGLAIYSIAINIFIALVFCGAGSMIFWRKSNDWMAWLVAIALQTSWVYFSPSFNALAVTPGWKLPTDLIVLIGGTAVLLFWWLFPDGRFVPSWTRNLLVVYGLWLGAYVLFPSGTLNPDNWPILVRGFISFVLRADSESLNTGLGMVRTFGFGLVMFIGISFNTWTQLYRYKFVSNSVQRQQTKWVVFGLILIGVVFMGFSLVDVLAEALNLNPVFYAFRLTLTAIGLLGIPVGLVFSILHYRLWDIDSLIQRTLIYGALVTLLGTLYLGSILLLQSVVRAVFGPQSEIVIALITLALAALVNPVRARLQKFIDRRFYREQVDFRQAFTDFGREVRTLIDLPQLLRVLVTRTTDLLHITYGAVFLSGTDGDTLFQLAESRNLPEACSEVIIASLVPGTALPLPAAELARLQAGQVVARSQDKIFPLLIPLIAPSQTQANTPTLTGVLALGPRLSEQDYTREDQALLAGLADQAGTALYVAQLISTQKAEAERRESEDRRAETHRRSPLGRAELLAQSLVAAPENAFGELHALTQKAGDDPDTAALLDPLPRALESLNQPYLAQLADGFAYIYDSQFSPELLSVGLRTLITALARPEAKAEEALALYQPCDQALEANSIQQIVDVRFQTLDLENNALNLQFLSALQTGLADLRPALDALRAYERVEAATDKLAYLVSAVERLGLASNKARTTLDSADRPIVQRLAENWLAVTTRAMSELQARAQITTRLLTRHTWQGDVISLVLELRNNGRGAATNINVQLADSPDYTALEDAVLVERLAPGDEAQVQVRARLHLAPESGEQFRARFILLYADPRGPDQVENFADVVSLMTAQTEFRFIPNPYVVGTPLQPGSPLFFGRQDVIKFIEENLAAAHRNNLVLIGQRRTGKTSLLKQLSARLGDGYMPVYIDGQTLGLDPGLPNFFLTLATEIAFALQDRGFEIEPPDLAMFADSPASVFERQFIVQVRAAIGDRHLLFLFDEFEELESAVRRGSLEPSIFGFLRHLIQHSENLSVIFCGTHRLEELAADYWNVLFNISLYKHVAYLGFEEARRLAQEPVAAFGMRYDDLALDKIWRVTAGHPYFLQLLCHSLVNQHNQSQRNYLTVADVNAALDDILATGEAHFVFLWNESSANERLVLVALSRMLPLTGRTTPAQVTDHLTQRGLTVERHAITEALHRLTLRDVLKKVNQEGDAASGEAHSWQLGLLGLWVEKYKSLSRVVDETR